MNELKLEKSCNNHGKSVIVWKLPDIEYKEIHGQITSECIQTRKRFKLKFKSKKVNVIKFSFEMSYAVTVILKKLYVYF